MGPNLKDVKFQYDTLVDRLNICNRESEIKDIKQLLKKNRPIVIYAPRRYGKTSLIKNVIAEDFKKQHKSNAVVFTNFMGVDGLSSITERFQESVVNLFHEITPVKSWMKNVIQYFQHLTISVTTDPLTGNPSLEIKGNIEKPKQTLNELFNALKKVGRERSLLFVFDEFQDISLINEAEALLRSNLQEITNNPVIILWSKRMLLEKMFSSSNSPFFNYGEEISLKNISLDDWYPYFNQRLISSNCSMGKESLSYLLDLMCNVPNSICEAGAWIVENCKNQNIAADVLTTNLDILIDKKEESFRFQLSLLSHSEKSIYYEIAKQKYVKQITSKIFLKAVKPSGSATQKIIRRLLENGFIEWEFDKGYRISDPLLRYFIIRKPL